MDLEWCPTSPKDPTFWNKNNKMPTSGWICTGTESVPSEEARPGREHKPSQKVKGRRAHCSYQPDWHSASHAGPNRLFWFWISVLPSLLLGALLPVDWQRCTLIFVFSVSWNILLFLFLTEKLCLGDLLICLFMRWLSLASLCPPTSATWVLGL